MTAESVLASPVAPEFLSADDIATLLRISRRTVFRLRQRGHLPQPVEVTRGIVRWRYADIRAYLDGLAPRSPRAR